MSKPVDFCLSLTKKMHPESLAPQWFAGPALLSLLKTGNVIRTLMPRRQIANDDRRTSGIRFSPAIIICSLLTQLLLEHHVGIPDLGPDSLSVLDCDLLHEPAGDGVIVLREA